MKHMTVRLAASLVVISLSSIGSAFGDENHNHEHDAASANEEHNRKHGSNNEHVSVSGDIRLLHPWTRATRDNQTLVFIEIKNHGSTAALLKGGKSPLAEAVEVVGFQLRDGNPTYTTIPSMEVAPNSGMSLQPEGLALKLTGLRERLNEGETFPVTLLFDNVAIEATVDVESADADQHEHAGHQH